MDLVDPVASWDSAACSRGLAHAKSHSQGSNNNDPGDHGVAPRASSMFLPKERKDREQKKKKEWFSHISQVSGIVVSARGLPSKSHMSTTAVFCVVKGIRSNNHLVDVHLTKSVFNSLQPAWDNEEFNFVCPESWGVVELVGLKFLVYDGGSSGKTSFQGSDDFLGGCDLDLSSVQRGRGLVRMDLELSGCEFNVGRTGLKVKRPRLVIDIACFQKSSPRPESPSAALVRSLHSFSRVRTLRVRIDKAKNLPTAAIGVKLQCVARVQMITGQVRELHRSDSVDGSQDPVFNFYFEALFEEDQAGDDSYAAPVDEPVLLLLDIYDVGSGTTTSLKNREHFGSVVAPLVQFKERDKTYRLPLGGRSQNLESTSKATKLNRATTEVEPTMNRALSVVSFVSAPGMDGTGSISSALSEGPSRCQRCAQGAMAPFRAARNYLVELRNRRSGRLRGGRKLYVEVAVERSEQLMPFANLMEHPHRISDMEDIELALNDPVWKTSLFARPEINIDTPEPAIMKGVDRIVFITGVVCGASGLANADQFSKSDPYCKVEAVMANGERHFVHRTPTVQNCLSPSWSEAFSFVVPQSSIEVNRLAFTVFDDDEGDVSIGAGDGDDFLGHVYVDLTTLRSGDVIKENMPLVGARTKKNSRSGFRVTPTLSVEIRVERRVQPVYKVERDGQQLQIYKQHVASRLLKHARYEDPSQQELFTDPVSLVAREYLHKQLLRDMNQERFVEQKNFKGWVKIPESRVRPGSGDSNRAVTVQAFGLRGAGVAGVGEEGDLALPGQPDSEDPDGPGKVCDFTQGCAFRVQRHGSRPPELAYMHSKFGRLDAIALAAEPSAGTTKFLDDAQETGSAISPKANGFWVLEPDAHVV